MNFSRLSHLKAITPIKDCIHDTLRFTLFEREVIDSPYFQRLHFILQNSTTYSAYPANKNSRFIHSLGVASVAGRLLTSALGNASHADLHRFLLDLSEIILSEFIRPLEMATGENADEGRSGYIDAWRETIFGQSEFRHSPFLKDNASLKPIGSETAINGFPALFLIDTIWEAIRICGLIHDVGHLPMSHSFEEGLKKASALFDEYETIERTTRAKEKLVELEAKISREFLDDPTGEAVLSYIAFLTKSLGINKDPLYNFLSELALHERRSLIILSRISNENKFGHAKDSSTYRYRNLIFKLALLILFASSGDNNPDNPNPIVDNQKVALCVRVLKSIVAGEIDADRLDYTIRDGMSCGTTIGQFDLTRIINNAILIYDKTVETEPLYRIAFYIRALSGIEQFYNQRHEGYKYLIYHRTSSRTEVCLQELLARIVHYCMLFPHTHVAELFEYYGYVEREDDAITNLLPANYLNLIRMDDANLRTLFFELLIHIKKLNPWAAGASEEKLHLRPIGNLLEIVLTREFSNIFDPFKRDSLRFQLKRKLKDAFTPEGLKNSIERMKGLAKAEYTLRLKRATHTHFGKHGVIALVNFQSPKIYRMSKQLHNQVVMILENQMKEELGNVSPALGTMDRKEIEEFSARIYFVGQKIKNDTNLTRDLSEFVLDEVSQYYVELSNRP